MILYNTLICSNSESESVEKWPCGHGYMASPRCYHFSFSVFVFVNKDYNNNKKSYSIKVIAWGWQ